MNGGEKMQNAPKNFEMPIRFELVNMEDLNWEERTAALDAIASYHKSENPEFRAGCTMVAEDGTRVSRHNEVEGAEGHAEMLALTSLYRAVNLNPSQRKLKLFALAASGPKEKLIRSKEPYGKDTPLNEIEFERPCGRCLKFISDYSGNFINPETGKDEGQGDDVGVLLVTATGQVLKTSMRSLYPMPHRPRQVPLKPLEQSITKSPDTYGNGK